MDIKDVLMSGEVTAEELLANFTRELEEAEKAVESAKAKERKAIKDREIAYARYDMITAIVDYLVALGVIDENRVYEDDFEALDDAIKDLEKQLTPFTDLAKSIYGSILNNMFKE